MFYQHDVPADDSAEIVAARHAVRDALAAIVAQTRLDMTEEWKEWNEAGWLKRRYLMKVNEWQGQAVGAWAWLGGTVQTVWQLAVLLNKTDREVRELRNLILTGQWDQFDRKIADYRSQGKKVLDAAGEVKELLIVIFNDEPTRDLVRSFPAQWWAAIPPDEQAELQASVGTQIAIDVVIAVLLAAFTAGAAGAVYGSAKWTERIGKLGGRVVRLLDKLQDAFAQLARVLRTRKRRVVDATRQAKSTGVVESIWKPPVLRPPSHYAPPLKSRHRIRHVKQGGVKKSRNTVAEPHLDMNADVAAINRGEGSRQGNSFTVEGRAYELVNGDHLVPSSGPGFHELSRGEFDALGIYNKLGDTEASRSIAKNVAGEAGAERALQNLEVGPMIWRDIVVASTTPAPQLAAALADAFRMPAGALVLSEFIEDLADQPLFVLKTELGGGDFDLLLSIYLPDVDAVPANAPAVLAQSLQNGFLTANDESNDPYAMTWWHGSGRARDVRVIPSDLNDHGIYRLDAERGAHETSATATPVRRCAAGERNTRSGFWFTPAHAGSRRYFNAGDVMPDVQSDYGVTLWQWDQNQDPPKL